MAVSQSQDVKTGVPILNDVPETPALEVGRDLRGSKPAAGSSGGTAPASGSTTAKS